MNLLFNHWLVSSQNTSCIILLWRLTVSRKNDLGKIKRETSENKDISFNHFPHLQDLHEVRECHGTGKHTNISTDKEHGRLLQLL